MRTRLAAALAVILLAVGAAGCGGDDDSSDDTESAAALSRTRIAAVRVYQHGGWTVPHETPQSVGKALAGLKPTLVTNLIRFDAGDQVGSDEISAWNTIRDAVLAASPEAHFGVELNALEYKTAASVEQQMATVRSKLGNEGWYFDFFTPAYTNRPEVVEAAISSAHENGEWIGGNVFGLSNDPPVPPGADYLAVQDFDFKINLADVRKLAQKIPISFHLGNAPQDPKSDGCRFMQGLSTSQREAYVTMRAKQQAANDFRFAYPVLFPECELSGQGIVSYNSITDGSMLPTMKRLMARYNAEPG